MDSQSVPVEPIVRARFLVERGLALFGRGEAEEATRCWKAALASDPGNRRAQEYLQFVEAECGIDTTSIQVDPAALTLGPEPIGPPRASHLPQYIPNPPDDMPVAPEAPEPSVPEAPEPFMLGEPVAAEPESRESPEPESAEPESPEPESPEPEAPEPEAPEPEAPEPVMLGEPVAAEPEAPESPEPEAPETEYQAPEAAISPVRADIPAPHLPGTPLSTADSEVEPLLVELQRRLEHDDFSGALDAANEILERFPDHTDAVAARAHATAHLIQMLEASLGDLDAVPAVRVPADEVIWLNLSHREGFVLSQVDGAMRYEDILDVCGMPRLEALRVLVHLRKDGVIGPA